MRAKNWKLSTDSDVFKLNRGSFIAVAETHGGYRISPFRSLKVYDFCILVWFVTRGDFFFYKKLSLLSLLILCEMCSWHNTKNLDGNLSDLKPFCYLFYLSQAVRTLGLV